MNSCFRALRGALAFAGMLTLFAGTSFAFVPQTIVVDSVNDFLNANLADNDSADAQFSQIDLRRVYITNDANKLYVGFGEDHTKDYTGAASNWTTVQTGIMISTPTTNGATNDMWGHRIAWTSSPHKPGYGAFVNFDNNWQEWRTWTGTAWSSPLRAGPGANGMGHAVRGSKVVGAVHEISFLLCELGVAAGDSIWLEVVVTQDGSSKGPLDASRNDAVQTSHLSPPGTVFDPPAAVDMPLVIGYKILGSTDNVAPTLASAAKRTAFRISAVFSEPVALASGQNTANYAIGVPAGEPPVSVIAATRRASQCNIVDLDLTRNLPPRNGLYTVTATNVRDLANNLILANGQTNVAQFHLKKVIFKGDFGPFLTNNSVPPDAFSVEGDFQPLSFNISCDTGIMTDTGVNHVWQTPIEFCVEKQTGAQYAQADLQWKFLYKCATYEPLADNRLYTITSQTDSVVTVEKYWADQDPSLFLSHAMDVIYRVDMTGLVAAGDTVAVNGSVSPLTWNIPSATRLLDNGAAPDAVAGDKIYSGKARFPSGRPKNLDFKYLENHTYECTDSLVVQGNRSAYLNDAAYDTLGGSLGPLTLAVGKFNFCTITSHAVKVVWHLLADPSTWPQDPNNTYSASLDGSQEVPSNASLGTGTGYLTLDPTTKLMRVYMKWTGLGTVTNSHIHGPAAPGFNGPVIFNLIPPKPATSPLQIQVGPLNATQEADLNAGRLYLNIHTSVLPGGEIRGRIVRNHAVAVRGASSPLAWNSDLLLLDNGVAPDPTPNDKIFSGEVTFPASTPLNVDWKYIVGGVYQTGFNKNVYLNDALFSDTTPIVFNDTLKVTTDVPAPVVARKLVLYQNEPNPFNPSTRIDYVVQHAGQYRLAVYDALGRRVRVLFDGALVAGAGSARWDGLTDGGERASSGLYLYALEGRGGREARKMLLLK